VVCEDREQRSFLGRLLEKLGVTPIRFEVAPAGVGAAEQWVRKRFPEEAQGFRSQAGHQANLALVIMVDGDRVGCEPRKAALNDELRAHGHEVRGAGERIAYLVPTWSIETWIAALSGAATSFESFDEATPYKAHATYRRLAEASPLVRVAVDRWNSAGPTELVLVPSLTDARGELRDRVPGVRS
jgi:hypothetical protein